MHRRHMLFRLSALIAAAALITLTAFVFGATESSAQHAYTFNSTSPIQITAPEKKEWYQRGLWPLIGSTIVIFISTMITIYVVFLQSSRALKNSIQQKELEFTLLSLNDFYNPLLSILMVNKEIFTRTGPPSFPVTEIERSAAIKIWQETKQKILQNNKQIEKILQEKSHLVSRGDSISNYNELMIHVSM